MFILGKAFLFALVCHAHLLATSLVPTEYLLTSKLSRFFTAFKVTLHSFWNLVNNLFLDYYLLRTDWLSLSHNRLIRHRLTRHRLSQRHHHRLACHRLTNYAWLLHHRYRWHHRWRWHSWLSVHLLLYHWLSLHMLHLYLLLLFV